MKEDWSSWGEWTLDVDGSWIRVRKCKNDKGPCRGRNQERRRKIKASKFDIEGFKKFIFDGKSVSDIPPSSWELYFLEKIRGDDSESSRLWFKKLIKWQEDKDSDWKIFKLEQTSDDDLLNKFKEGFIKFKKETVETEEVPAEDYEYEWETVVITKTKDGETVKQTYKDKELPEEWKNLIIKDDASSGQWKNFTLTGGSVSGSWSSWTSVEEIPEGEEVEWSTFTVGEDGKIQNHESKTKKRRKRSTSEEDVNAYDPTCGVNMCALCEMELE